MSVMEESSSSSPVPEKSSSDSDDNWNDNTPIAENVRKKNKEDSVHSPLDSEDDITDSEDDQDSKESSYSDERDHSEEDLGEDEDDDNTPLYMLATKNDKHKTTKKRKKVVSDGQNSGSNKKAKVETHEQRMMGTPPHKWTKDVYLFALNELGVQKKELNSKMKIDLKEMFFKKLKERSLKDIHAWRRSYVQKKNNERAPIGQVALDTRERKLRAEAMVKYRTLISCSEDMENHLSWFQIGDEAEKRRGALMSREEASWGAFLARLCLDIESQKIQTTSEALHLKILTMMQKNSASDTDDHPESHVPNQASPTNDNQASIPKLIENHQPNQVSPNTEQHADIPGIDDKLQNILKGVLDNYTLSERNLFFSCGRPGSKHISNSVCRGIFGISKHVTQCGKMQSWEKTKTIIDLSLSLLRKEKLDSGQQRKVSFEVVQQAHKEVEQIVQKEQQDLCHLTREKSGFHEVFNKVFDQYLDVSYSSEKFQADNIDEFNSIEFAMNDFLPNEAGKPRVFTWLFNGKDEGKSRLWLAEASNEHACSEIPNSDATPEEHLNWYKIVEHPFSVDFSRQLLREVNKLPCLPGKAGKKDAFIHVYPNPRTNSNSGPEFLVGEGTFYPPYQQENPFMDKLFDIIRMVQSKMKDAIEKANPGVLLLHTFDCNVCHFVIGSPSFVSAYGAHNDGNPMITIGKGSKPVEVMQDRYLPTQDNLIVFTVAICTDPYPNNFKMDVTGPEDDFGGSRPKLATVYLPNMVMHIQGPGTNSPGKKHDISIVKKNAQSSVRVIMTFRLSIDPTFNKDCYYERCDTACGRNHNPVHERSEVYEQSDFGTRMNVISGMMDFTKLPIHYSPPSNLKRLKGNIPSFQKCPRGESQDGAEVKAYTLHNKKENKNDRYLQLTKKDYNSIISSPQDSFVRVEQSFLSAIGNAVAIRELMKLGQQKMKWNITGMSVDDMADVGVVLDADHGEEDEDSVIEDDEQKEEPNSEAKIVKKHRKWLMVGHVNPSAPDGLIWKSRLWTYTKEGKSYIPLPGQQFPLNKIASEAGLEHKDRTHCIFVWREDYPPIVIITQPYKNDKENINNYLERAVKWNQNKNCYLSDQDQQEFWIGGSGGLAELAGSSAPNAKVIGKGSPLLQLTLGQKSTWTNNIRINQNLVGGPPFALFAADQFTDDVASENTSLSTCTFMNYYEIRKSTYMRQTRKEFESKMYQEQKRFKEMASFQRGMHYQHYLSSVFCTDDWNKIRDKPCIDDVTAYEKLYINSKCNIYPEIPITISDAKNNQCSLEDVWQELGSSVENAPHWQKSNLSHDQLPPGLHLREEHLSNDKATEREKELESIVDELTSKVAELQDKVSSLEEQLRQEERAENKTSPLNSTDNSEKGLTHDQSEPTHQEVGTEAEESQMTQDAAPSDSQDSSNSKDMEESTSCSVSPQSIPQPSSAQQDENFYIDPTTTFLIGEATTTNFKVDHADVLKACCPVQYASALRLLRKGIFSKVHLEMFEKRGKQPERNYMNNENPTAVPLVERYRWFINQGLSRNASPSPNRVSDVNVHFLFQEGERCGLRRKPGKAFQIDEATKRQEMKKWLFKITIFRFTGRFSAFEEFMENNGCDNAIPEPGQISTFLDFMKSTVEKKATKSLSDWQTEQYRKAIPDSARKFSGFLDFAKSLDGEITSIFDSQWPDGTEGKFDKPDSWVNLRDELAKMFHDRFFPNTRSDLNIKWLAQMILADMGELFEEPFGRCRPEDIVSAFGALACLQFYQNNNKNDLPKSAKESLAQALAGFVEFMNKNVSKKVLQVFGLFKDEHGVVRNIYNGVRFDAIYAEHFFCKVYIQWKFMSPNYRKTEKPLASSVYCQPAKKITKKPDLLEHQLLEAFMKGIVISFLSVMQCGSADDKMMVTLPQNLILEGEEISGPANPSQLEEFISEFNQSTNCKDEPFREFSELGRQNLKI